VRDLIPRVPPPPIEGGTIDLEPGQNVRPTRRGFDLLAIVATWDAADAVRLMTLADGEVERLGVPGSHPTIQAAAARAVEAHRTSDMAGVRKACEDQVSAAKHLAEHPDPNHCPEPRLSGGADTGSSAQGPALGVDNVETLHGDVIIYFDGACEPTNPGGMGTYGFVVQHRYSADAADPPRPVHKHYGCCGDGPTMTNNVAEYMGLGHALRWIKDHSRKAEITSLTVRGDSKLVIHQMTGEWASNKPHLARLRDRCRQLLKDLGCEVRFEWVGRDRNTEADELTRQAYTVATGEPFPEHPERRRKR
jgi:ribonuclease HI